MTSSSSRPTCISPTKSTCSNRRAQQRKRSTSKDDDKRAQRSEAIEQARRDHLKLAAAFPARARHTGAKLNAVHCVPEVQLASLDDSNAHAERRIDQIDRRVLQGERIPHAAKVFASFQPHIEWINKGKAGVVVELGLRVAVGEDQLGLIFNHRVMLHETDNQAVILPAQEAQQEQRPRRRAA